MSNFSLLLNLTEMTMIFLNEYLSSNLDYTILLYIQAGSLAQRLAWPRRLDFTAPSEGGSTAPNVQRGQ
jgi:hypothetical protein